MIQTVYVNQSIVNAPWGGGNMWRQALSKYASHYQCEIANLNNAKRPNILLISSLDGDGFNINAQQMIELKKKLKLKLFVRVNENDARKNTNNIDKRLIDLSKEVDGTIFVSNWLKDYFLNKKWHCENNVVIHNGVDEEIFKKNDRIDNNSINVVTHHWSNNPLKGFDVYDQIDDWVKTQNDYTFTYIGRDRGTFKNTKLVQPLFGKALGDELGKYDVYVSASKFDPGPNHILEAISCNLPTFSHSDGGGCVEFSGLTHVYDTFDDLKKILIEKKFIKNAFVPNKWCNCVKEYVKFMLT